MDWYLWLAVILCLTTIPLTIWGLRKKYGELPPEDIFLIVAWCAAFGIAWPAFFIAFALFCLGWILQFIMGKFDNV